jgi:hypothetical protein
MALPLIIQGNIEAVTRYEETQLEETPLEDDDKELKRLMVPRVKKRAPSSPAARRRDRSPSKSPRRDCSWELSPPRKRLNCDGGGDRGHDIRNCPVGRRKSK